MAGHSKWSNNKYRKATQDSKRSKIFTKLIRELITASKVGGCDISSNPRLRTIVDKALSNNMMRNTINRAINKSIINDNASYMENIFYEGYGPSGIAVMVKCLSDNRNRIASEIRHTFSKTGNNLGITGSVSYLFKKKGIISVLSDIEESILIDKALEIGAEDVLTYSNSNNIDVFTNWKNLISIKDALNKAGLQVKKTEIAMIPSIKIDINAEIKEKLQYLINMLKKINDVKEVYHNANFSKRK